jgi:hypothetical protein
LHDLATPSQCQTPTWPRAKRHHPDARRRVSPARPPARPLWGGLRKMLQTHPAGGKNLKNPIRPSARQAETTRARCGVGLGCAGRVDAPEGIGRPAPKATTTMTTGGGRLGKSGAKAPDRNRSPARPRPTTRRASYEPDKNPVTPVALHDLALPRMTFRRLA